MRFWSVFLILYGATAAAEYRTELMADLNGNGIKEHYALLTDDANIVTLQITEPGAAPIRLRDFTWKGALYGQEPGLDLAPNGSVRVMSQNEGCCRHRWRQITTLAFRDKAYRVAGMTYEWRDTLNLEVYGVCDVNFLSARGYSQHGEDPAIWFDMPNGAPTISEWSVDASIPDQCDI